MTLSIVILALVTVQRLGELVLAQRNTRRLLAQGAVEHGVEHYPLMIGLHAAWLAGLWLLAWDRLVEPAWLAAFLVLQALRVWVIASLGGRWTTRIIVLPGEPLVRKGPYRFLPHPNYLVVVGELLVLPLAFGLLGYGLAFTALNTGMLWVRIRAENTALSAVSSRRPASA